MNRFSISRTILLRLSNMSATRDRRNNATLPSTTLAMELKDAIARPWRVHNRGRPLDSRAEPSYLAKARVINGWETLIMDLISFSYGPDLIFNERQGLSMPINPESSRFVFRTEPVSPFKCDWLRSN